VSADSPAERVARGAALLDREYPGWHQRIDLSVLDLANSCRCILGQVYRPVAHIPGQQTSWGQEDGYDTGTEDLNLNSGDIVDHGFDFCAEDLLLSAGRSPEALYAELDELWIGEIRKRTGGGR
jgi:hypothetical protein